MSILVKTTNFPRQGSSNIYLFKMSSGSLGSRMNLVRRMQHGGDLQDVWLMFDHTYRVKCWTTVACHDYNHVFRYVMIIDICDILSKDVDTQCLLCF